jgi:Na+-driven multidrug efflux pump
MFLAQRLVTRYRRTVLPNWQLFQISSIFSKFSNLIALPLYYERTDHVELLSFGLFLSSHKVFISRDLSRSTTPTLGCRTFFLNFPMSENSPLLGDPILDEANISAVNNDEKPRYGPELSLLARTSIPISCSFALQNIVQAISIFVVGGLGTFELGVASYGYMFASSTGAVVAMGGATALDTLCSQAISSAKPEERNIVLMNYLQRGVVILTSLYVVFIVPLWWVSGDLFVLLGQEESFARETGHFLRILIPGGLLQIWAECFKKYLQVQGHSFAISWAIAFAAVIGIAANFLLVQVAKLGVIGAPIAHTVYHLSTTICLVIYMIVKSDLKINMRGSSRGRLGDWTRFANFAITGILTTAAESFRYVLDCV